MGVVPGQLGEARLGAVPRGQDLLRLGLDQPINLLVRGALRDGVGKVVLGDQHVAHVHGLGLIQIAAVKDHHIPSAGGVAVHHGGVAGLAALLEAPVDIGQGAVGALVHLGVGGVVVLLGLALQIRTGVVGVQDGLGGLLGGAHSGGFLLIGGLNSVAVGVLLLLGGAVHAD